MAYWLMTENVGEQFLFDGWNRAGVAVVLFIDVSFCLRWELEVSMGLRANGHSANVYRPRVVGNATTFDGWLSRFEIRISNSK
jgi:hypothetical protein